MNNEYPKRRNPAKILVAISVVAIVVVAAYAFVTWPKPTFTIYTYDSFMAWGEANDTQIFQDFERQYGVNLEIRRLETDANGIVARLKAEEDNPVADVVIGIDNILILQSEARSVLEPYTPSNIDVVDSEVVSNLDGEHYVVPFDLGLVTIIYNSNDINSTTHPSLEELTFSDLADMASMLVTEDPRFSSPGLSFLLSQIAVYTEILDEDWKSWWTEVREDIDVEEGWTEAWETWYGTDSRKLLVSYGTDPAYDAFYSGEDPVTAVAPYHYNGNDYAWMQIEGMGLVKNGPNPELGKAFIGYCLSPKVQSYVALNQWMFPVNTDVEMDVVFQHALHPDEVEVLNSLLNSTVIEENLSDWLDQYETIMIG
jgi:thiamine transport system substrate-binding protein